MIGRAVTPAPAHRGRPRGVGQPPGKASSRHGATFWGVCEGVHERDLRIAFRRNGSPVPPPWSSPKLFGSRSAPESCGRGTAPGETRPAIRRGRALGGRKARALLAARRAPKAGRVPFRERLPRNPLRSGLVVWAVGVGGCERIGSARGGTRPSSERSPEGAARETGERDDRVRRDAPRGGSGQQAGGAESSRTCGGRRPAS